MQTQARICPLCIDDHLETTPCKEIDILIEILKELKDINELLKEAL